jgi:hypothetical protein
MCYIKIMNKLKKFVFALIIALGVSYVGLTTASVIATTLKIVQSPKTYLYSGLSASATSMRITPYPRDLDQVKLTYSDLGDNSTVTVDPGLKGVEEIIMISNMVDNGDNTATLTISGRNLASKYPYTATGTGRAHSASAVVVFSNNPQVYGRLAALENFNLFTQVNKFLYGANFAVNATSSVPCASDYEYCNKNYIDNSLAQGAATSSESTGGIAELATDLEVASSTDYGTSRPLVLQAKNSTSTYGVSSGLKVVVTQNDGKIDSNFIRHSDAQTWTGGTINTASSTNTATTTIAASNVNSNALNLNGLNYAMPPTRGASSTVLTEDGSGNLRFLTPSAYLSSATVASGAGTGVYSSAAIPAGTTRMVIYADSIYTSPTRVTVPIMLDIIGVNTLTVYTIMDSNAKCTMTASTTASIVGFVGDCTVLTGETFTATAYFYR